MKVVWLALRAAVAVAERNVLAGVGLRLLRGMFALIIQVFSVA
jgi:hypothetical protein